MTDRLSARRPAEPTQASTRIGGFANAEHMFSDITRIADEKEKIVTPSAKKKTFVSVTRSTARSAAPDARRRRPRRYLKEHVKTTERIMNDKQQTPERPPAHPVTVNVNTKPVALPDHKTTGRQIKEAAVAQGVAIEVGFKLFRVTGSNQPPVLDDEQITVRQGEDFRAVAADDNS